MRYTIRSIQAGNQRRDKPGDAEQRIRERLAGEQSHKEAMERFGTVTPQNFHEVAAWQESRRRELLGIA